MGLVELPERLKTLGHRVNLVTWLVSANAGQVPHADNSFKGSGMIWLCLLAFSLVRNNDVVSQRRAAVLDWVLV